MKLEELDLEGEKFRYYMYNDQMLTNQDLLGILKTKDTYIEYEWERLVTSIAVYMNLFQEQTNMVISKIDFTEHITFLALKAGAENTKLQYLSKLKSLYKEKQEVLDQFLKFY